MKYIRMMALVLMGCLVLNGCGKQNNGNGSVAGKDVISDENKLEDALTNSKPLYGYIYSAEEDKSISFITKDDGIEVSGSYYGALYDKKLTDSKVEEFLNEIINYTPKVQEKEYEYSPHTEEYPAMLGLFSYHMIFENGYSYIMSGELCYPDDWDAFIDRMFEIMELENEIQQIPVNPKMPEVEILRKQPEDDAILSYGNGVVWSIDEKGMWVVTAGHVVDEMADAEQVTMIIKDEEYTRELSCEEVVKAQDADLAFLHFDTKQVNGITMDSVSFPEKESYDAITADSEIQIQGWLQGQFMIYEGTMCESWIYVEDMDQYMQVVDCKLYGGMSGSALCDVEGNLIGIACGINEDGRVLAVPLHVVEAQIERYL